MILLQSARVRLTLWYILIVSVVSILFSATIYSDVTLELRRSFEAAEARIQSQTALFSPHRAVALSILADDWERAKHLVLLRLIAINSVIISVSGIAAYFLAGKTLAPIEAAVDEQKRFIADASHELRTPLTAMKTEIEVALRDKSLKSKDAFALLHSNLEEVNKMQSLSNYLLALSKYENSNANLPRQKVSLLSVIEKAIEHVTPLASGKKISIKLVGDDLMLMAHPVSLTELITILLDNAVKYSSPKSKIEVKTKRVKNRAIVIVTDHGVGIKASDLPYIFNRFYKGDTAFASSAYRADSSRSKTHIEGHGLGLAIAKSIVDAHKGAIEVKSIPSKGSTFTITLPL